MDLTAHQAKYFAHDLTRQGGLGLDRLSMSLFDAAVDLNPHQIEAALFALQSPLSKGVLLADEVGLGKTIEAGIVLCQYWAERRRKLLVLCPASIRKQWALELQGKFNLPALVLDEWMRKVALSSKKLDFELIYVNGDNNLPNVRRSDECWRVHSTEVDFQRLMFEGMEQ